MARAVLAAARPSGTEAGRRARAFAVETRIAGITSVSPRPRGAGRRSASTPPSRSGRESVRPPKSAEATLSGCPSIRTASRKSSSAEKRSRSQWFASVSPATMAAALEPRPRARGMRERIVSATVGTGRCATRNRWRNAPRTLSRFGSTARSEPSPRRRIENPWGMRSAVTVMGSRRASPRQSNPGPRLDVDAGTSARQRRITRE